MKKLFLVVAFALFSSASFAQGGCGDSGSEYNNGCGSGCVTMKLKLTGILEVDVRNIAANGGSIFRKPTSQELARFDDICNS